MAYWDCPKCAAENSLDATSCWRCGYQYFPGYGGAVSGPEQSRTTRDSIEKHRQRLQAEIRKNLEDALERSKTPLERLTGDRAGSPGRPGGSDPSPSKKVPEPGS